MPYGKFNDGLSLIDIKGLRKTRSILPVSSTESEPSASWQRSCI